MKYKNGFFQLLHKEDGTYLKIYPAMNGGEDITFEEVVSYLNSKKIIENDIKELHRVIATAKQPIEVKVTSLNVLPENECVMLTINNEKTLAVGRFYPPSSKGKFMTKQDILSDLARLKITHGIMEGNIDHYLKNRQFSRDIVLAKATMPVEGRHATIQYTFKEKRTVKPKMNEDGSVDFHQLDIINHVNKDEILAKLTPAVQGKPGCNLLGHPIPAKKVINKSLRYGKNIYLSEDGTIMYSKVSGHVSMMDDKVFVSDTFEVVADVDASTGDIDYDGNVMIRGNVITGFYVKAKGDIIVNGVVEGATLISGGQIILKRGIQGSNRGVLRASGDVVAKFIENSTVTAGGYITTDAIMHSKVTAKGDIIVSGKRGFITGGEIRSGGMISLKTGGSKMGTSTLLEVGINPVIMEEYRELELEIEKMQKEKEKMHQIILLLKSKLEAGEKLSKEKEQFLIVAQQNNALLISRLKESNEKCELLRQEMESNESGRIRVEGIVFPGVKIVISNVNYFVRTEEQHCQYVRDRADIKVLSI